jgi:hypothetical protein
MKFRNLKFDLDWINFNRMEKNGKVVLYKRAEFSRHVSGWPNHFGLVAQLSGIEQGRSANGGAGDGPAGSSLPAAGSVREWR